MIDKLELLLALATARPLVTTNNAPIKAMAVMPTTRWGMRGLCIGLPPNWLM